LPQNSDRLVLSAAPGVDQLKVGAHGLHAAGCKLGKCTVVIATEDGLHLDAVGGELGVRDAIGHRGFRPRETHLGAGQLFKRSDRRTLEHGDHPAYRWRVTPCEDLPAQFFALRREQVIVERKLYLARHDTLDGFSAGPTDLQAQGQPAVRRHPGEDGVPVRGGERHAQLVDGRKKVRTGVGCHRTATSGRRQSGQAAQHQSTADAFSRDDPG